MEEQKNNPLHGKTLEMILVYLVNYYGWDELGHKIRINSFNHDPSVKSSLQFLRKTPWARQKVEDLYLKTIRQQNQTAE
ncbi:MAG: VF530 family DNA-binding protein [Adhaeribacter sp.]